MGAEAHQDSEARVPKINTARTFSPASTLVVAVLGFFVVTFDAVVVNVALPTIRRELGGGITGLQWVVDGYTLMFAALLLTAGSLSDRIGAKRAFGMGLSVFVVASAICGISQSLPMLIIARFAQGGAAAVMMPSSMALVGQAYPNHGRRAHALATWAMGGAIASSSAPILGGLLTLVTWRLIFFVNIPVGAVALLLLAGTPTSPERSAPIDWLGQVLAVAAMGGLVFGAIEAGAWGLGSWPVVASLSLATFGIVGLVIAEQRVNRPMLPPALVRLPAVRIASVIGFAFMAGYYGLPFMLSLYFQQLRGVSPLWTGVLFLPMFVIGLLLTPFSSRLAERFGTRVVVGGGLLTMTLGMVLMGLVVSPATPDWVLSVLMILVGIGGPLVIPMTTAHLLREAPASEAGTASGIFNSGRQVGGALAVAVFGALLADRASFVHGQRVALFTAAALLILAFSASLRIGASKSGDEQQPIRKGVVNA
ncbi:MAG: MFS transporter [Actinomycetota bacterium]|nr:MFS transporter [Actinomycetota bacterium]